MEWITLIIAIIGLCLSIYNSYLRIVNDQRRVKVIIEYISWVEAFRLIIINTGIRPVTILNISAVVLYSKKGRLRKKWEEGEFIPGNVMPKRFGNENSKGEMPKEFPITLKDGEYLDVPLSESIGEIITTENQKIVFSVFDAEGNVFNSKEYRLFDAKYHHYKKIDELPKYRPNP